MGILLNLIQNTERLETLIENEVLEYAYELLSKSSFDSCLLISYNNKSELTLSFVIGDPARVFSVNFKNEKYDIRMKENDSFAYENLSESSALKVLRKLERRQAI